MQQAAWRLILPEIRKIVKEEVQSEASALGTRMDSEFKVVHSEIRRLDDKVESMGKRLDDKVEGMGKRLDEKIDGLATRLDGRIDELDVRLGEKIEGLDKRLGEKVDGLDKRLDVVQRLAVVEAKLREYEQRPQKD